MTVRVRCGEGPLWKYIEIVLTFGRGTLSVYGAVNGFRCIKSRHLLTTYGVRDNDTAVTLRTSVGGVSSRRGLDERERTSDSFGACASWRTVAEHVRSDGGWYTNPSSSPNHFTI